MSGKEVFSQTLYKLLEGRGIRVEEKIASGSTKTVYKGRCEISGEDLRVAIKIITPDFLFSSPAREAFLREAEVLRYVQHPNVEKLISAFMTDEFVVLITEFIDGISLYSYLERFHAETGKYLPWEVAVKITLRVAEGLEAIHSSGFVHRDLSANNVMLNGRSEPEHVVKLIDLGLAKNLRRPHHQSLSSIFSVQGTPLFAAPELLEDAMMVDERADSFSLATLLYYLLTLEYPFGPEEGYYERVKNRLPVPITHYREDIPLVKRLEEIIWENLSPVPHDRERAGEMKRKLHELLEIFPASTSFLYDQYVYPFLSPPEFMDNSNSAGFSSVLSSPAGKINREVEPGNRKERFRLKPLFYWLIPSLTIFLAILISLLFLNKNPVPLSKDSFSIETYRSFQTGQGKEFNYSGKHEDENIMGSFGSRVKRVILRNGTTEMVLDSNGKIIGYRLHFSRKKFIFILKKYEK